MKIQNIIKTISGKIQEVMENLQLLKKLKFEAKLKKITVNIRSGTGKKEEGDF